MNKQVLFIECRDYSNLKKLFPYIDGTVFSSQRKENACHYPNEFGDINDSLGEFFSISMRENNKVEIRTDICGFYSLFWKEGFYQGKRGLLISNCFHSLSLYSEHKFNAVKIIPNILSKNQFFIQDYSNKTSLNDIMKLGWNESIVVSGEGVNIKKNRMSVNGTYEDLIHRGVGKAKAALKLLNKKKNLNLYFSGGKDSRAILAMLFSAGIKPRCTTQNPNKYKDNAKEIVEKDFKIVTSLVERYGLDWFENSNKSAVKINFNESLEQHTFYRNGYYLFSPSQYIVYDHDWGDEVQLRGGGGGLFKSTWGEYIRNSYINKKIMGKSDSIIDDAVNVFKALAPIRGMPDKTYLEAESAFLDVITEISMQENVSNIYDLLDEHYIGYRNRSHFGHIRSSEAQGKTVFFPLINEYFYSASLMLSPQEKNQGKLIFDIIEYCFPELNDYPYDLGYHDLLPNERTRKTFSSSTSALNSYIKNYEFNQDKLKGIFQGKPFDSNLEESKFIDASLNEFLDNVGVNADNNNEFSLYLSSLKSEKKFRSKLCATLASLPLESNEEFSKGHFFKKIVE